MSAEVYERGLCERVTASLRRQWPNVEVGLFARLPGGHSGLTYRVETSEGALVVKSVPPGQKPIGRHDMLRQARIMDALAPTGVPVPAIVATDESEPAWFAMQLVGGESLEPVLDDPEVAPALAAARMLRAAETLPALHDVPLDKVPVDAPNRFLRWTSSAGGPARWRRCPRTWCRAPSACTSNWRTRCRRRWPPHWSTATTASAT